MRRFALLGIVCAITITFITVGLTDVVSARETLVVEPFSHADKRLELTSLGTYQYDIDIIRARSDSSAYILTMDDINYRLFISGQPYVVSGYQAIGSSGTSSASMGGGPQVIYLVFVNNGGSPIEINFEGSFHPSLVIEAAFVAIALAIVGFVIMAVRSDQKGQAAHPMITNDPYLSQIKAYKLLKVPRQLIYQSLFLAIIFSYSVMIFVPLNGLSVLELMIHLSPGILALVVAGSFSFFVGLFVLNQVGADRSVSGDTRSFVFQLVRITLLIEVALTIFKVLYPSLVMVNVTGSTGVSPLFIVALLAFSGLLILGAVAINRPGLELLVLIAIIAALVINPVLGVPAALAMVYTKLPGGSKMRRGTVT